MAKLKYPHWKVGDIIEIIVGMPGPDRDLAVICDVSDGKYHYEFMVYGAGDWHRGNWEHQDDPMYSPLTARPEYYPYYDEYAKRSKDIVEGATCPPTNSSTYPDTDKPTSTSKPQECGARP